MATPEIMKYFNPSLKTELIVDASPVGLGAILTQVTADGGTNIVAYASRSLTDCESRYSQSEREALAVVWGIEHFHLYLYGSSFQVTTDHKPLEPIFTNPTCKATARVERLQLRLQPYKTKVVYKPKNALLAPPGNASVEPPKVIPVELPPIRRSARARRMPDHLKDYVT